MRRTPGWTRLAGIALELTALAFLGYVVMGEEEVPRPLAPPPTQPPPQPSAAANETVPGAAVSTHPMDFIQQSADLNARYYRALGDGVELLAGFYSDGRVRLADGANHRFAGMLQGAHAELLDLESNQWSEVVVHTTPGGTLQLELRGGPYDARVLTCESIV